VKRVYIAVGVPGCGKSTYFRLNGMMTGGDNVYISANSIRRELYGDEEIQGDGKEVFTLLKGRYKEALLDDSVTRIVIDNTSMSYKARKDYYDIAAQVKAEAKFIIVFFNVSIETAHIRNLMRERQVPAHIIDRMYSQIEGPTESELEFCEVITRL
jgi:predicted kinase